MRSVGVLTLGCKVNTYESEYVINILKENNYQIRDFSESCDVYIINTCTVTNTSDIKSKKMIRSAIHKNPDACVVAMGCFIEANKEYQIEGLDIIIGNKDKSKIVELLEEYFTKKETIKRLYQEEQTYFEDMYMTNFPGRTRAFVKIQDGCENFCSYCIIPFVRGKCRSKKEEKVIEEIQNLVENGYQEVVLTGIHTGNYGVDLNTNFASLLKKLVLIKGLKRLRISSIEITELTEEVLEIMKNHPIIVDHLHIPLQAGSDEILKLMNRKYDLKYFKEKLEKIRSIRPDISITTDVIVGFPSETEELFEQTVKTCQDLKFSKIHVFPYSERQGTKAMDIPNHCSEEEKKKRARRLLQISKELELNYAERFLNQEVEILVETVKEQESIGHTKNYLQVKIPRRETQNTFTKATIKEIQYPYCITE